MDSIDSIGGSGIHLDGCPAAPVPVYDAYYQATALDPLPVSYLILMNIFPIPAFRGGEGLLAGFDPAGSRGESLQSRII